MFKLDHFSHKFLDRRLVFMMDLLISLASSMVVAVVAFFFHVPDVESRLFTIVWGVSSVCVSALMFYVFKTYLVVIRHFTFKDTVLYFIACLFKVLIIGVVFLVLGLLSKAAVIMRILIERGEVEKSYNGKSVIYFRR